MNEELEALGRRAVACKHWRWMPGMRCVHRWTGGIRILVADDGTQSESYVVLPDADGNAVMVIDECGIMGGFPNADSAYPFIPDLSDPATLGCLLALVREAWSPVGCDFYEDIYAALMQDDPDQYEWYVWGDQCGEIGTGATEAEALVAALEAAP